MGGLAIDVVRKNIKNLYLRVHPPDGRVQISAPAKMDDAAIRQFVVSKMAWIEKHRAKLQARESRSRQEFVSGEGHYFRGECYLLNVIYGRERPKAFIRDRTYIDLYVREGSDRERRKQVLFDWYRSRLKEQVPRLIRKWESVMGVRVENWGVKCMKTRWGTCNVRAKRIWINLELIKRDRYCLEYVIVHEMTHLLERYHNDRFKSLMDRFLPNWRFYKDELNRLPIDRD